MLSAKPFTPNINVEDVPAGGIPITVIELRLTSEETKSKIENAKEFTLEFSSDKLNKSKFPDSRAQRMFSASSDMAKKLALLSGQRVKQDGTYDIDEEKLPGKKSILIKTKSSGKFANQDTLTLK